MQEFEPQLEEQAEGGYPRAERIGAAIAHGSLLVAGLPVTVFLLPMPWSFLCCPVLAYMIARSFRRRARAWGAFQGMQAAVMQLVILVLAIMTLLTKGWPNLSFTFAAAAFFLFLYSLWGALDTGLGYDFRYVVISRLLEGVSRRNMSRQELRHRWINPGLPDRNIQTKNQKERD